ncbi:MAG: YdcH family protein [Sandarakinorhabdus sp.]|nr:YdcH family protein [Sandarakinorhabdus sp.]
MANAHLTSLNARHASLEKSVAMETRRPLPDQARLAELKRKKLRLKEEIGRSDAHA